MNLNYLLSRHQVSLMRAETAASAEARHVHRNLARLYADEIRAIQRGLEGAGMAVGSL